jgi:hypothetical protein
MNIKSDYERIYYYPNGEIYSGLYENGWTHGELLKKNIQMNGKIIKILD